MNKAFVREPDDTLDIRCPRCGVIGIPVARQTVLLHVPPDAAAGLSDSASFCATPRCEVAYYDALEQFVPASLLKLSIFPKDLSAPICPCFGLTAEDVEADAKAGRTDRIKAHLARAQTAEARCHLLSPTGTSCIPEVQRYFLKCSHEARHKR